MRSVTFPLAPRSRRRGAELESALLEAAWLELTTVGYARLTMESVARRALTSEPVLYRRWPNKDQLVLAALTHQRDLRPVNDPDTGSLRGDLIAYLLAAGEARATFFAIAAATAFAGLLGETGRPPADVRDELLGPEPDDRLRPLYQRAHLRGEIDLHTTPTAVLSMPFELTRHDMLMTLTTPSRERVRTIIDDLFLPLVHHSP